MERFHLTKLDGKPVVVVIEKAVYRLETLGM
jgi:hypothetical protein